MLRESHIVILAAGQGARLLPLTKHIPKPMLKVGEETLIQRIVRQLLRFGALDISVIVGHQKELLSSHLNSLYKDIRVIDNSRFQEDTNIYSTYLGIRENCSNLIIESDIIFEDQAVDKMLTSCIGDNSVWFTSGNFLKSHVGGALKSTVDGDVEDLQLVDGYSAALSDYKKTLGAFWLSRNQAFEYKELLFQEYQKNMKQYYMTPWIANQKRFKSREVDLSPYFSVSFNTPEDYKSTLEALDESKID